MSWNISDTSGRPARREHMPRSMRDLTPTRSFNARAFFREMVWKALMTRRVGHYKRPSFPNLTKDQLALTWIGHASFLVQFNDLNALIDPNFAKWLFLLKRIRRAGMKIEDLPPVDLVLLTHAHFDHFHKPTIRRLPAPKIGVMPWGMGDLASGLGFERIIELEWWETFTHGDWSVTLVPCRHWGARVLHDDHRGYGGFVLRHGNKSIYHSGDSAYYEGFSEIGERLSPDIALLPIGTYEPDSFRRVHMSPVEALDAFFDLRSKWLVPMHYGTFRLSFEEMDEPPRWLKRLGGLNGVSDKIRILDEGIPEVF
ncbi:MAG: MBL fold metallo-hydrolase [Verrucomicrobia bacterium]|nr:MBL fold metallo-hydrolase [Verrucomicrobiota bacterium]